MSLGHFFGPPPLSVIGHHLPLGISFFTFQALSYLIDTYKKTTAAQTNPINLALYIALFPQLIAGPIVRYHDVSAQIEKRTSSLPQFAEGIERFILGLGKKVLIANTLGEIADIIFSTQIDQLSTVAMWIGAVCYSLQIYFDFSGYSDMAIGLGKMFGFNFLENFNYPYNATSIKDFWRRWHISLSNWFRDYLYFPLGGSRKSSKRTVFNLFAVFFLCGLWHGASWNFIVWGLYHGFFLSIERGSWGRWISNWPRFVQHVYTLLVVIIGWVIFRAENMQHALQMIGILFGAGQMEQFTYIMLIKLDQHFYSVLTAACIFINPIYQIIRKQRSTISRFWLNLIDITKLPMLIALLVISIASLSTGVYNPFIYFRF